MTIVGLGLVGSSIGLALKGLTSQISITGHDPDPALAQQAKKRGAIDRSHWNLPAACEAADVILIDLSLDEMEKTFHAIGDVIRQGAVVLDTLPLKQPVLELAAKTLPPAVQFVGGHVISRTPPHDRAEASAEWLQGATFYLVAPEGVSAEALDSATNLATAVGADPHYIDALEHDGLMSAMIQLPLLGALAFLQALTQEPGWDERVKAVGIECAALIYALARGTPSAGALLLANRDNVLHWVDVYAQTLARLRGVLAGGNKAELDDMLAKAMATSQSCLYGQRSGEQTGLSDADYGSWQEMFLGRLGRRRSSSSQDH